MPGQVLQTRFRARGSALAGCFRIPVAYVCDPLATHVGEIQYVSAPRQIDERIQGEAGGA